MQIHIYVGGGENFWLSMLLNDIVESLQEFLLALLVQSTSGGI
jgi:hypothetical protein